MSWRELVGLTDRLTAYRFVRNISRPGYLMDVLSDLKAQLADVPGIDAIAAKEDGLGLFVTFNGSTVQFPKGASIDAIRKGMNLRKIDGISNQGPSSKAMTTISDQLKAAKAQIADARQAAATAVSESADAARVVLQEVDKARKEAADLRAEVADLTNGGPT